MTYSRPRTCCKSGQNKSIRHIERFSNWGLHLDYEVSSTLLLRIGAARIARSSASDESRHGGWTLAQQRNGLYGPSLRSSRSRTSSPRKLLGPKASPAARFERQSARSCTRYESVPHVFQHQCIPTVFCCCSRPTQVLTPLICGTSYTSCEPVTSALQADLTMSHSPMRQAARSPLCFTRLVLANFTPKQTRP